MPISDELLTPIPGDNPSGSDLRYEPIFKQLKDARFEEDEGIPEAAWERSTKKRADHRTVVKLASDALTKQSKDIQLAAFLTDSLIHMEGFSAVAPSIDLLRQLQETFWTTIYPQPDDGEDYEMRSITVEKAARGIAQALAKVPLTSDGLTYTDYVESRAVGYEKDATNDAKRAARNDAVAHGKLTAEDFDKAFAGSPKKLYLDGTAELAEALEAIDRLDQYQTGVYNGVEPNLRDLRTSVETLHQTVESLLNERRKTEPDPVPKAAPQEGAPAEGEAAATAVAGSMPMMEGIPVLRARTSAGAPTTLEDAYAQVVESALFLFERHPQSPVPYLICTGLRFGETAMQEAEPSAGFAVGPSGEVRRLLRTLAANGSWAALLKQALPVLASECSRAWLDLHRYIWKAGEETGAPAICKAVQGAVKNLLVVRPELRYWTLEDDTGAANPRPQKWLDTL